MPTIFLISGVLTPTLTAKVFLSGLGLGFLGFGFGFGFGLGLGLGQGYG